MIDVELGPVRARFTTRDGGVSSGPYASLNLGPWTDDEPDAVAENRRRVAAAAGVTLAGVRQVHGTRVEHFAAATNCSAEHFVAATDCYAEADGVVAGEPGVAPVVLVADCLPVIVGGEGGVAALHAGWKGLAGGILGEGVRALRALGVSGGLRAAVGPGAGPCCYEVGEEVAGRFGARHRHGRRLDLKGIAAEQLREAGVAEVTDVGLCTMCDARFFSHRRDGGVTGRQAGLGWLS